MADPQLFTLTLSDRQGRYVSLLLDEAVSDQPDFLVAAVAEMKGRLSGEIPTVVPGAPVLLPQEIDLRLKPEDLLAVRRPIKDTPQG